jgi:DNA (cytosine-5)-methyltransferase 1
MSVYIDAVVIRPFGIDMKLKILDLFSGIGGFSLGLERAGMETIAFCEFDKHAQKVLKKHWPDIPIYEDVRTLDATKYRGTVDVVTGGFPCQDLSVAGKQVGFQGERSSLYREMLRIISECMPRYAIFENVPGLLTGESGRWFGQFLYDLDEIGFNAEWHCISAAYIGAPHHRDRVWIIAYPREERGKRCIAESVSWFDGFPWCKNGRRFEELPKRSDLYPSQLCGSGDGIPKRVDRLARLGNAVVPQIPEAIGRAIMAAEGL